jgi:hypothetical protein
MGRAKVSLAKIRERLLAEPSLIDVGDAVARVIARRDRCTPAEALASLGYLGESIAVDRVFKHVLPAEHRRAKGSVEERRYEFFRIMRGLFPVDWEYLDECYANMGDEVEEEPGECSFFYYGIMICSMRPFETWEVTHNWNRLPLAYQLTDALFGDTGLPQGRENEWGAKRKWDYLVNKLGLEGPVKKVSDADKIILLWAFSHARGPLGLVPDAHKVLAYDTGSIFYDYAPEDGIEPYEWTRESVEFLKGQYKVAQQVERRVESLSKWLDADPVGRARRIINYYTKHRRVLANEGRQRIRAGAPPRALVDVL